MKLATLTLLILVSPHAAPNIIYQKNTINYKAQYFRNLLDYYKNFIKIFHVDNDTFEYAKSFFDFGDGLSLQHMVYNHDFHDLLKRPIGGNVLNVFFFKDVKKISGYIKDYSNISGRDVLMIITHNKTFNKELPADLHIKHAQSAGNILVLNFMVKSIEFYHLCTYCGSYENRVTTVQKTNTSRVELTPNMILPNSFRCFYGNKFTVLFNQYFPFMHCLTYIPTKHRNETFNKCLNWEGSEGMLLDTLSKTMNFTYDLIALTEYITVPKMLPHITRNKKIDFAIGGIGLSAQRIQKLLSTRMINYENVVLMYKIHTGWKDRVFAFSNALPMDIWFLLWFTSLLVSIALLFFLKVLYKERCELSFFQLIQVPPRMLIEQPVLSPCLTRNVRTPVLIVLFCWMIGCVTFNASYKSSLSSLVVHPPIESYNNIFELLDKGYRIGVEAEKLPYLHLILKFNPAVIKEKFFNITVLCRGLPRLVDEKVAIAGEKSFLQNHCQTFTTYNYAYDVNYTPEPLSVVTHGWLFRKGAPFVESFNRNIRNMQSSGLMSKWLKDALWQRKRFFKDAEDTQRRVKLEEFTSHFTLYSIGITMSFLVFVYEHIKCFLDRRKNHTRITETRSS